MIDTYQGMTRQRAATARLAAAALLKRLDDALLVTTGGPDLIAEYKALKVEVRLLLTLL
jgi:hypothetical protein